MGSAIVQLKKGEGRLLKSGGYWVFDNEIASVTGSAADGEIVFVRDWDGYPMGCGFYNAKSKIRVRILSRDMGEEINGGFFRKRLQDSWDYRKKVIDTSSCRLVFGEADFLPGLVIDKYEDILVIQISSYSEK